MALLIPKEMEAARAVDELIFQLENPEEEFVPTLNVFYPLEDEVKELSLYQFEKKRDAYREVPRNAVIDTLQALVDRYSHSIDRDPAQVRMYTTNRLLEESAPTMPPAHRLKSLELLGKITEIALFTERSEMTVKKAPIEDLQARLYSKLKTLLPEEFDKIAAGNK